MKSEYNVIKKDTSSRRQWLSHYVQRLYPLGPYVQMVSRHLREATLAFRMYAPQRPRGSLRLSNVSTDVGPGTLTFIMVAICTRGKSRTVSFVALWPSTDEPIILGPIYSHLSAYTWAGVHVAEPHDIVCYRAKRRYPSTDHRCVC